MDRLEYATTITAEQVQAAIDQAAALGYIRARFDAARILDRRFEP
jgi:hypothetical protein